MSAKFRARHHSYVRHTHHKQYEHPIRQNVKMYRGLQMTNLLKTSGNFSRLLTRKRMRAQQKAALQKNIHISIKQNGFLLRIQHTNKYDTIKSIRNPKFGNLPFTTAFGMVPNLWNPKIWMTTVNLARIQIAYKWFCFQTSSRRWILGKKPSHFSIFTWTVHT